MATKETTKKTIFGQYALIVIDLRHTLIKNGIPNMNKTCTNCKAEKNISEYYKMTRSTDGLQKWCKVCMNEAYKKKSEERRMTGPSIVRDSKVCQDCNTRKPINQFYVKRAYSADGYGSYCKPCWVKRTVTSQKKANAKKLSKQ
jgi:hypothetical protein